MKSARRALLTLPVIAVAALALSGCADPSVPTSVATDSYGGLPPEHSGDVGAGDMEGPLVLWLDEGSSISVTTWGSSGCPAILTEVNAVDAQTLDLQYADTTAYVDQVCTADYAPHTSEIDLPADITGSPLTVSVSFDGEKPSASVVLD
ncbi:hypothetical protein [Pseudoclavibacter terrae]|uniref:Uncharacterized protein n=1 Tax=Pseudoclavibacter terrae TaxID=1530195 RepID=A0A7J5AZV0_9MICO|nr:hypothetical protein [Pseudoclavibacter terrae]KAB1637143.1 hypothetical protein F8O03_12690 [Pseudoclavibacter terrae]